MTTIIYNDVILRDCETLAFDQQVQMDESGTDVLFSRFTIRVASNMAATRYPDTDGFGITPPAGATVIERMADVHKRLSEVRRDFWMLIDNAVSNEVTGSSPQDQAMLIATGITTGSMLTHPLLDGSGTTARATVLDVENGPKVKDIAVRQIFGGRGMRVEVEFEVCRKICVPGFVDTVPSGAPGNVVYADARVLSNRWSIAESKDENWATTRVLEGTLRVAHSSFWPHAMRLLCIPSLLKGYQRVRQSFVDDPTQLVLKYRIEDRQAHAAPPPPAVTWQAHHAETSISAGTTQEAEVRVRLTGPPGVDKLQLIGAAGKVLASRIQGLIPERDQSGNITRSSTILRNAALVDVLHEPTIELMARVRYSEIDYKLFGLRVLTMGASMANMAANADGRFSIAGYHPRVWPVPLPYDSKTPAGIFNCYLQHPCSVWHDVPNGITPTNYGSYGVPEPEHRQHSESGSSESELFPEQEFLPQDTTDTAEEAASQVRNVYAFPYTFVELQNRYITKHGWSQLPLATTNPAATKTAALVRLHGAVTKRVLTMTATREGLWPVIPSLVEDQQDHNDIREVLADDEIELLAPQIHPGGVGRSYSVRLLRTYLLERAPRADEKLRSGSTALDRLSAAEHWLDLGTYADAQGHLQYDSTVVTDDDPPSP